MMNYGVLWCTMMYIDELWSTMAYYGLDNYLVIKDSNCNPLKPSIIR